jgi:hypothetical protein
MARTRITSPKPRAAKSSPKPTRAALAKTAKKHFPRIKRAVEKALRDAGLPNLKVHEMRFSVDEASVAGNCPDNCPPGHCKLSSTGGWMCV